MGARQSRHPAHGSDPYRAAGDDDIGRSDRRDRSSVGARRHRRRLCRQDRKRASHPRPYQRRHASARIHHGDRERPCWPRCRTIIWRTFRPHLRRYTDTTRTTIEELREDIHAARTQGYSSVLHGEWREGIAACACAIVGRSGELVGAIGMSGPDIRVKRKQIKEYSVHVMKAARDIGQALGRI